MAESTALKTRGLQHLKNVLNNESIRKNFENILEENAGAFMSSIIELYQSDTNLQKCDANAVVLEALKAATLKLPINKALGFAYLVPYGSVPTFQLGYKGYIQLAQRSGQYKYINADIVYEGEKVTYDRVTGMLEITGEPKSEKAIGYFAYFQLLNGFEKAVYWSKEKVLAHAKRFSKQYANKNGSWQTNFDAMALKTVIRNIISKYGIMSVEFANTLAAESVDDKIEAEFTEKANGAEIKLPDVEAELEPDVGADDEQPASEEQPQSDIDADPGF